MAKANKSAPAETIEPASIKPAAVNPTTLVQPPAKVTYGKAGLVGVTMNGKYTRMDRNFANQLANAGGKIQISE